MAHMPLLMVLMHPSLGAESGREHGLLGRDSTPAVDASRWRHSIKCAVLASPIMPGILSRLHCAEEGSLPALCYLAHGCKLRSLWTALSPVMPHAIMLCSVRDYVAQGTRCERTCLALRRHSRNGPNTAAGRSHFARAGPR